VAVLIKKYGNRRLYDTGESRYITQEELAAAIKRGVDVRVVDAKTHEDLTQATLAQLVIENAHAARALPVALLTQLIRLDDDALVEFFGRYVTSALEMYLTAKRGVQSLAQSSPLLRMPLGATDALTRMWMQSPFAQVAGFGGFPGFGPGFGAPAGAGPGATGYDAEPATASTAPGPAGDTGDQLAAMRRELDELKKAMRGEGGLGKPGAKRKPKREE
jgi:polyhydroxyalkanoate synthesis repressor PhaR